MVRGEIWLAELPMSNNSIQYGLRPVILVSNDKALRHSPVIHAVPITTRKKSNLPTHVEIGTEVGLKQQSIALCEQSMLIAKDSLVKNIGYCDCHTINRINNALMIQFGLDDICSNSKEK